MIYLGCLWCIVYSFVKGHHGIFNVHQYMLVDWWPNLTSIRGTNFVRQLPAGETSIRQFIARSGIKHGLDISKVSVLPLHFPVKWMTSAKCYSHIPPLFCPGLSQNSNACLCCMDWCQRGHTRAQQHSSTSGQSSRKIACHNSLLHLLTEPYIVPRPCSFGCALQWCGKSGENRS